jgi:hypothetical protein
MMRTLPKKVVARPVQKKKAPTPRQPATDSRLADADKFLLPTYKRQACPLTRASSQ